MSKYEPLLQQAIDVKSNGGDVVAWYESLTPEEQQEFSRQLTASANIIVAASREFAEAVRDLVEQIVTAFEPLLSAIVKFVPDDDAG